MLFVRQSRPLILGYEPSKVRSRLFLADYSRSAFDLGITVRQFLQDFNPMFTKGEGLLINNSSLPYTEARTNSLGVMHKAIIDMPDEAEHRIVNSTMLAVGGEEIGVERQEEFVRTDEISQKVY